MAVGKMVVIRNINIIVIHGKNDKIQIIIIKRVQVSVIFYSVICSFC